MPGRAQQAGRTSGYIRNKRFLKKLWNPGFDSRLLAFQPTTPNHYASSSYVYLLLIFLYESLSNTSAHGSAEAGHISSAR
jgi:hypothetical protein